MIFQSTRPIRGATHSKMQILILITNFNPRAPYGARRGPGPSRQPRARFQSTRPIRGATKADNDIGPRICISIHAPHTGRDCATPVAKTGTTHFNPRAPYGARLLALDVTDYDTQISIHAPHTGRDHRQRVSAAQPHLISIHAPHTGRDGNSSADITHITKFQSTRPIRGATGSTGTCTWRSANFNPRAPYGARRSVPPRVHGGASISIHAPHTGRDSHLVPCTGSTPYFNPRAPYGARPPRPATVPVIQPISIHAPHTGRDGHQERG